MNKEKILETLLEVVNDYLETKETKEIKEIKVGVTGDTALFGKDSLLDSMGLVNVIIDIESRFLDENIEISLTSESAMSVRNSPFRTIGTLADFIWEQLES